MTTLYTMAIAGLFALTACGSAGEAGDECFDDGDCAEGLECHVEEHDGHEDEDTAHEDEEEEHEDEGGVCESHDDHDH